MTNTSTLRLAAALFLALITLVTSVTSASDGYTAMREAYAQYRSSLSENAYNEPLHIKSSFENDLASGEIYAAIEHNFVAVSSHLTNARQWCDMLVLHVNVKGCYLIGAAASNEASAGKTRGTANEITLFVGRNYYQSINDAYAMNYKVAVNQQSRNYMKTILSSVSGPFGTSDYLLEFEVIPLAENTSFMHFKYSYRYGFLAKVALGGYLATLGRKKVGFTVDSYDENNKPVYVKGLQGIIERNSMRYFIAIKAFLDTYSITQETWNKRIEHWYDLALPYKRQLVEIENKKYLKTKHEEYEKKVSLETAIAINAGDKIE